MLELGKRIIFIEKISMLKLTIKKKKLICMLLLTLFTQSKLIFIVSFHTV